MSDLVKCERCPRLVAERQRIKLLFPGFHAAPVGSWGAARPLIWIVGLAPGLRGAGRTGKAFVGDASGQFLFASLHRTGLATEADPQQSTLPHSRITNVVKCVPPGNAPSTTEQQTCSSYLASELSPFMSARLRRPRAIVVLGTVAHRMVARTLGIKASKFEHMAQQRVHERLVLISSYHPSRLNVNTGRLTSTMLDAVFACAAGHVRMRATCSSGSI